MSTKEGAYMNIYDLSAVQNLDKKEVGQPVYGTWHVKWTKPETTPEKNYPFSDHLPFSPISDKSF